MLTIKRAASAAIFAWLLATSAAALAQSYTIPSDPKATYAVLERGGNGNIRTITYRRSGPSGQSYSKREYDCNAAKTRYLGTGDTMEAMKGSKPEPSRYGIVDGSIASYLGGLACNK
ncbi:hypothetical protein [Azohydromonas lata]|uniref:Uncharacterized protein n=1 Tax=Azohydromonas lata TaxID=45677 RepID=A0ABU5IFK3_9BURK|nr:hypothetical protein [Azohydromonas lata]MDZ5457879.1 hypothetical protein [Azohydromonas lata]